MKTIRASFAVLSGTVMAATLLLAGCASSHYQTDVQRLEAYQAFAGAPVKKIPYFNPIGWEEIDDEHILVTMKPKEVWLMRLSGPCLDFAGGSPALVISSQGGYVSTGFDRVATGSSQLSCRIEEIRQVDTVAMREARAAQPSGT
jgi:outer membrane murein-binding lipoprotein Lpp